jgi:hypothetical protein
VKRELRHVRRRCAEAECRSVGRFEGGHWRDKRYVERRRESADCMLVPGKGCQRLNESGQNFVRWSFGAVVVVALAVVIADVGAAAVVTVGMQLLGL